MLSASSAERELYLLGTGAKKSVLIDGQGSVVWVKTYSDKPSGVAIGLASDFYVSSPDGLKKYDYSGAEIFSNPTYTLGVAIAPDGTVYAGGPNYVDKLDSDGAFVWRFPTIGGGGPRGVSSDASGNLYFNEYTNRQLTKVNSAGVQQWTQSLGSSGSINVFFVSDAGVIYHSSASGYRLDKRDTDGSLVWQYDRSGTSPGPSGVWVDSGGDVYAAYLDGVGGDGAVKISSDNLEQWDVSPGGDVRCVVVNSRGKPVFAFGEGGLTDSTTLRVLSPVNGAVISSVTLPATYGTAQIIAKKRW